MNNERMYRLAAIAAAVSAMALTTGCKGTGEAELFASAQAQIDKQEPGAAILPLKSALQANPQSGEARLLLGRALFMTGDAAGAVVELERAVSLKVSSDRVVPLLAQALVVAGRSKQVIDGYARTTLGSPQATADLKAALSAAYVSIGNLTEAEQATQAALTADPSNVPARLQMARLVAGKSGPDEALTQIEALLRDKPRIREAWLHKAQLLWVGKQDVEGAKKAFAEALAIDPKYTEAHAGLAALNLQLRDLTAFKAGVAKMRQVVPGRAETMYFAGQAALQDGDIKTARAMAEQLLKAAPSNARVLQLAAAIELSGGSTLVAESHLRKVLAATPDASEARRLLATTHLRGGEPDKALVDLRPLLDRAQPSFEDLTLAAEAHLLSGDLGSAESFYKRAVKLNPGAVRVRTSLALTQVARGKGESDIGVQSLETISAEDKGSTIADLALINARLGRGEIDQALKAIDRLQEKEPNSPRPHQMRGQVQMQRKDGAGARKSYELALTKDKNHFPAISALASLDVADKKLQDARQRFQGVLDRDPKNARAMVALALLLNSTGAKPAEVTPLLERAVKEQPGDASARLAQIDFFLGRHDYKSATTAAEAAVADLPNDLTLLDALGRAQAASGNLRQAIGTFTKLTTLRPNSAAAHLKLAESYIGANDQESAARVLRRALEIAPDSVAARRSLVMVAVARKRFDEAMGVARQLQRERPTESVGWQLQSDIHAIQRDWPAAITAMRESLKRLPSSSGAARMVELFSAADRLPDADAFVSAWLKEHPKDAQAPFQLGTAWLLKRDYARAEARFKDVLAVAPEHPAALNNVAWLMTQQGKPGAAAMAERAVNASPDQAESMDTLAQALAAEGQVTKAIEWQRKAVGVAANQPSYALNLARLLIKSGDKVAARAELDRLRKLGTKFPNQSEVTELLKSV